MHIYNCGYIMRKVEIAHEVTSLTHVRMNVNINWALVALVDTCLKSYFKSRFGLALAELDANMVMLHIISKFHTALQSPRGSRLPGGFGSMYRYRVSGALSTLEHLEPTEMAASSEYVCLT